MARICSRLVSIGASGSSTSRPAIWLYSTLTSYRGTGFVWIIMSQRFQSEAFFILHDWERLENDSDAA